MRRTRRTTGLLAAILLAATFQTMAASPAVEWTYQNALVTSERGSELQYVFIDIEGDATLREQPMLDLLMEVALFNATNLPYSQVDLMRITRIVYRSGNPRYVTAMSRLASATVDPGPYMGDQAGRREDVNELAFKFARRFAKNSVPQYEPGTISIPAMRARQVDAALAAKHPAAQAQKLAALPTGTMGATIDDVFAVAGPPEVVAIGSHRSTYKGQRTRNEDQMQLLYRGLGRVTFFYERDLGWHLASVNIDPLRFEREMPYWNAAGDARRPEEAALIMQSLLSGSFRSIRLAMESFAPGDLSLELTDTAAEVLWQGFADQPNLEAGDAYIAIIRALLARDAQRYTRVLSRVTAESTDVRIQGMAGSVLFKDSLPSDEYLPGSISLEAQRRKYPPLYPESLPEAPPP
jgi:hypothetical protein